MNHCNIITSYYHDIKILGLVTIVNVDGKLAVSWDISKPGAEIWFMASVRNSFSHLTHHLDTNILVAVNERIMYWCDSTSPDMFQYDSNSYSLDELKTQILNTARQWVAENLE